MILLHRFSSFGVACLAAVGFSLILVSNAHPFVRIVMTSVLMVFILARLLSWQVQTFQFWHLLGTPLLLYVSSFGPFFLLENSYVKIGLATVVVLFLFLFVEHVFSFVHLPIAYQPFTLEYLTGLLHILSVFFLALLGFGLSLFLQMPLWILSPIFFATLFFIIYGTLWIGKIDSSRARPYAFAGAVLTTELFVTLTFLPTGYYTNAAFLTLGVYVLLGLSRAHALHNLSNEVRRRYLIVFSLLTILIAVTSQWV